MTTIITIADNKYWKTPAESKRTKIEDIRKLIVSENKGISLPIYRWLITPKADDPKHGPWQQAYWRNVDELKWWQEFKTDPWGKTKVKEEDVEKMKTQATSWVENIVDSTNAETGKTNEYDSEVKRIKGTNYHQRGHYFIFYEDDSKEHWLALYPPFNDNELRDGHNRQAFVLNFDKPVKKFVDVYTCVGCGAIGQGFTKLHKDYDYDIKNNPSSNNSDDWNIINKGRPFDYWAEEFYVNDMIKDRNFNFSKLRDSNGTIMSKGSKGIKHCLGNENHTNDFHVWEPKAVEDKDNKTFDKAYGYIPKEGTIQWRLARDIKNEEDWVKKRIPYHADKLWNKREFTEFADRDIYQQKAMSLAIDEVLKAKNYVIGDMGEMNDWLKEALKSRFWRLISAKRSAYLTLESLIKKHLNGANIEEIKKEAETLNIFIPPSTDPIKISPISTAPEVIRRIWNQQVERFIREGKAKEFYAACNPRSSLPYQSFETNINSLYQQLFDRLGFNHRVENIQQLAQVAQIVVS